MATVMRQIQFMYSKLYKLQSNHILDGITELQQP